MDLGMARIFNFSITDYMDLGLSGHASMMYLHHSNNSLLCVFAPLRETFPVG
jgi:hypothetical protein